MSLYKIVDARGLAVGCVTANSLDEAIGRAVSMGWGEAFRAIELPSEIAVALDG